MNDPNETRTREQVIQEIERLQARIDMLKIEQSKFAMDKEAPFESHRRKAEQSCCSLEEQLRQSQKMEALGRMAGGVAHDFNNQLQVIITTTELVRGFLVEAGRLDERLREDLSGIMRAARQACSLTGQLLAFARKDGSTAKLIDLNLVVRGVERMILSIVGEGISIETSLSDEDCPVFLDPSHAQQILINLVVNARDAMPKGGRIRIETSAREVKPESGGRDAELTRGMYQVLEVSDIGTGMDQETIERIFEPFFTTKSMGHGTGLGLSTVYGIVKQASGHVRVRSVLGEGTTFEILLPVPELDEACEAWPDSDPRLFRASFDETVLLVEDEGDVRRSIENILKRCGYTVLSADSAKVALSVAAEHEGPIDLLVADIGLPDGDGRAVAERLVWFKPEIRVLLMSGRVMLPGDDQRTSIEGAGFIRKPFETREFISRTRQLIEGRPG